MPPASGRCMRRAPPLPQVAWTAAQLRRRRHAGNAQLSPFATYSRVPPPPGRARGLKCLRRHSTGTSLTGDCGPKLCRTAVNVPVLAGRGSGDDGGGCNAATAGDGLATTAAAAMRRLPAMAGRLPATVQRQWRAAASARAHSMIIAAVCARLIRRT